MARSTRVSPDGEIHVVADAGRWPERCRAGPRWALLRLQQRWLQLAHRAGFHASYRSGRRLHGRRRSSGSTSRPGRWRALHALRRHCAARPQRHRVRRPRRLLVQRFRQDVRRPHHAWCGVLRPHRRQFHPSSRTPDSHAQRRRAVSGWPHAVRDRNGDEPPLVVPVRGLANSATSPGLRRTAGGWCTACRLSALRLARGGGGRQHLRGDAGQRRHQRLFARRRTPRVSRGARRVLHQHLLRRRRTGARPSSPCPATASSSRSGGRAPDSPLA